MLPHMIGTQMAWLSQLPVGQEDEEDKSDESDFEYNRSERNIGDMSVAHKTISGLAANDEDMGSIGFGEHGDSIALGRSLWQTEALTSQELSLMMVADSAYTVLAASAKEAVAQHRKQQTQTRTAP